MSMQTLENAAIGILSSLPERTSDVVRSTLKQLVPLYRPQLGDVSDHDIEEAAKRIEAKLFIKMQDAASVQEVFEEWLPQRRAENQNYFYGRYRRFLGNRGFPPEVLGVLDKDTDKVVGLLQDPARTGSWNRRGLVVGHVQSGKTANYTGVICKAADYGYRFIVVLTGIQEDLRVQTQERIEEGFTGVSSEATLPKDSVVGVGLLGLERRPWSLTTRDSDFKAGQVNLTVPLQSLKEPLVLVMKKNSRILTNLIDWIKTKSAEGAGRISGVSMLLIDDEADNASINVAADGKTASAINARIRELLDLFERNVYLGYTATPFANIFIDPESTDEWARDDLFPRNFIVSLDAPTNYVGASRIFSEDGDLRQTLVSVDDHLKILPEKHKITHPLKVLPPSLIRALQVFILSRAIRTFRGNGDSHSSMLVNVSRFNDVQTKLTGLLSDQLNTIRQACQGHYALKEAEALKDPTIKALRDTWDMIYDGKVEESWSDIQPLLAQAVGPVDVRKINSKSPDALDYRRYKDKGLHVVAVGGFALSRGFTLEGLTVTYFLRNSLMYDTLLQMGRWFGYRDGYSDVCRIFMTPDAIGWYGHISEAIDELRDEFRRMERSRRTPEEFGLKVRSHPQSLIVTARNKMRTGRKVRHTVAIGGRLIETYALRSDAVRANRDYLTQYVKTLRQLGDPESSRLGYRWRVPATKVIEFIRGFQNHDDVCINTQSGPVSDYILSRAQEGVDEWDVCLFSPVGVSNEEEDVGGLGVKPQDRSSSFTQERQGRGRFMVNGSRMRVASRGQEKVGIDPSDIQDAEAEFRRQPSNVDKSVPDRAYREKRKRPLLMLHLLKIKLPPSDAEHLPDVSVVAWGASFPASAAREVGVEYVVNTRWWTENYGDDLSEAEEEIEEGEKYA